MKKYIWIFLIAMLPLIEIRGAVIYAGAHSVPLLPSMIVGIIGNMLPVPLIFYFARKILIWGQDKKYIGKIFSFFLKRGEAGGEKLMKKAGHGLYAALFLFVAIPLPGTGAWTGTLAASILNMDFKKSIAAVISGVVVAGLLIYLATTGLISAWFAVT
ncbi:MAG TPA: small multi-drug export protein [Bacillota bacterium]|nr:small multi-drug export protein [Bacillota bacterium]